MHSILTWFRKNIAFITAFIVLLILISSTLVYLEKKDKKWEQDYRAKLYEILIAKKSNLEKALYSRIYYTRGIAAFVSYNPSVTDSEFLKLAKEYMGKDEVINSMSLAEKGVIRAIYPTEGHEEAIGLNLLAHARRKEIVEQTIKTGRTFVAGPVELVEGGIAFVSYTPIFNKTNSDIVFWGITDIVIHQNRLFKEVGLSAQQDDLLFALKGYNGKGHNGALFWGDSTVFSNKPVTTEVMLPDGTWILGVRPRLGWSAYVNQSNFLRYSLLITSVIISLLIWFLVRAETKLRNNAKDLKATFLSLDNLIIEFNAKGDYIKIAPVREELLITPRKALLGKNLSEVFDEEMASFFKVRIKECLTKKSIVQCDYPLQLNGVQKWFHGRFSYRGDNCVIFSSYDVTDRKIASLKLENSEHELRRLNGIKDTFLSIISHDLRTPIITTENMLGRMIDRYDTSNDDKRKAALSAMKQSLENVSFLLSDLLKWSKAQQKNLTLNITEIEVAQLIQNQIKHINSQAQQKEIELSVQLDVNLKANADWDVSQLVLRNLLTNAIKFSKPKGKIEIEAIVLEQSKQIRVSIRDYGIGMTSQLRDSILSSEKISSNAGTSGETGNGLGLMLCQELVKKQQGEFGITSELEKGTTVWFTLNSTF